MANLSLLKQLLKQKGLTIQQLSDSIGISNQGVQRIIKDNSTRTDTMEKIAKHLNVPVSYFFPDDNDGLIYFSDSDWSHFQEQIKIAKLQDFEQDLGSYLVTTSEGRKFITKEGLLSFFLFYFEVRRRNYQENEFLRRTIKNQETLIELLEKNQKTQ